MLQVTQPREPCFKFALRFEDPTLPKAMIRNGRSGWYYRVLEAGRVAAGSLVTLEGRFNPEWTIPRMNAFIHAKNRSPDQARELAAVSGLAETWIPRLAKLNAA
jgi:MOSC domain-containing protein YiiM